MPTNDFDDFMPGGGYEVCLTCGAERRWDGPIAPTGKLCDCSERVEWKHSYTCTAVTKVNDDE